MESDRFCVNNIELKEILLFSKNPKYGITDEKIFEWIENNGEWVEKSEAENDPTRRHVASYAILYNSKGQILTYHRAGNEKRLTDWSIGVGGHIEYEDFLINGPESIMSHFEYNTYREICEETDRYHLYGELKFHSFIVSDRVFPDTQKTICDAVHIGHAWTCKVPDETRMIAECKNQQWMTLEQLAAFRGELESWSQIMVDRLLKENEK